MSPRGTLILLVVVALLGGGVWWLEVRGADERAEAEDAAKRVFQGVRADEVEWVEIRTADDQRARLERGDDGAWRLVEPVSFPADAMTADGIASGVTELVSERVFEEREELEAYGLAGEPWLRFGTDAQSFTLRVGEKTPVGGNTYVAPGDGEPVYAVATWRTNALRKTLADLRDARVLDFDRNAVTAIEARWPGGKVRASREQGDWRLVEPLTTDADAEAIEGLLADLAFLRADSFVDDPPPDAELGLDEPAYAVDLFRGSEAEPLHLRVGRTDDGSTRAVRGRDGAVYRIAASRLDDFPRTVDAWRFKELASFDVSRAERLELVFRAAGGGDPLRIEGTRADDGWDLAPQDMAPGKGGALLTELSGLEAEKVAADAMGDDELAALGLAPPRARIRVLGAAPEQGEAPVLADVSLGVLKSGRGVAAQRAGRDEVFWLDPQVAEHVPVSLEAWRNRFVGAEPAPDAPAETPSPEAPEPEPGAETAPEG